MFVKSTIGITEKRIWCLRRERFRSESRKADSIYVYLARFFFLPSQQMGDFPILNVREVFLFALQQWLSMNLQRKQVRQFAELVVFVTF